MMISDLHTSLAWMTSRVVEIAPGTKYLTPQFIAIILSVKFNVTILQECVSVQKLTKSCLLTDKS